MIAAWFHFFVELCSYHYYTDIFVYILFFNISGHVWDQTQDVLKIKLVVQGDKNIDCGLNARNAISEYSF